MSRRDRLESESLSILREACRRTELALRRFSTTAAVRPPLHPTGWKLSARAMFQKRV